jgi:hypothetical protein
MTRHILIERLAGRQTLEPVVSGVRLAVLICSVVILLDDVVKRCAITVSDSILDVLESGPGEVSVTILATEEPMRLLVVLNDGPNNPLRVVVVLILHSVCTMLEDHNAIISENAGDLMVEVVMRAGLGELLIESGEKRSIFFNEVLEVVMLVRGDIAFESSCTKHSGTTENTSKHLENTNGIKESV